jgi:hypothetical protein
MKVGELKLHVCKVKGVKNTIYINSTISNWSCSINGVFGLRESKREERKIQESINEFELILCFSLFYLSFSQTKHTLKDSKFKYVSIYLN